MNQEKNKKPNILKYILEIILIISFFLILLFVIQEKSMQIDTTIFYALRKHQSPLLTIILQIFTHIGGTIGVISIAILLSIIIKKRKMILPIWLNLGCIVIMNQLLKRLIHRPRPTWDKLTEASGFSFPSGHTMTAVAFYGFLIYLVYTEIKNQKVKRVMMTFLSFMPILIGISRIYLGVHYASDVLAGAMISLAYLIIFITILQTKDKHLQGGNNEKIIE